jgi:hypothetical protein
MAKERMSGAEGLGILAVFVAWFVPAAILAQIWSSDSDGKIDFIEAMAGTIPAVAICYIVLFIFLAMCINDK